MKDSKHKVRDGECKNGAGESGKRFDGYEGAFSRQRSGEKRRDGSSLRVRKGAEGFSVSKKQNGEALNAERRREDSKRGGSYGGRGSRRSNSICPVLNLCGGCQDVYKRQILTWGSYRGAAPFPWHIWELQIPL